VETVRVKYPDSIARHKARASKRSRSMAMSEEVLVEAAQVKQRSKVKFSFCSPPAELAPDAAQTGAKKKSLERKSSVISIEDSPEIEETAAHDAAAKTLKRQKWISVEDSPEAEQAAKRSLFEAAAPVNKTIEKLKKRESKRRSRSIDNWSELAVATPPAEPQSVASLLTPTAGGEDDTPSKRRRTKQSADVSTKKPKSANYYLTMLDDTTAHLEGMVQIWLERKAEEGLSDMAHEMIDSATGQTNLLITKKFEQFRKLIGLYDRNAGEKKIFSDDLDGFWSMVYMQVDDLYQRFAELQTMADNGWQQQASAKKPAAKKRPKKKVRQPAATKSSGLQDFIRKIKAEKMRSESSTEEVEAPSAVEVLPPPPMTPSRQSRRLTLSLVTPRRRSDGCSGCTPSSKSAKKRSRRIDYKVSMILYFV
jgi:Guanylate-kinase-associated protein (GKAP) protein